MNRRPRTLILALVAVVALASGALAFSAARRSGVAFVKPKPLAASEPGPTHVVPEAFLASDREAEVFARENAVALMHWIAMPPGGLFTASASKDITITALGDGNKPSWVGTWTVKVTSSEIPRFRGTYTQSATFGPGTADQPAPHARESGGLSDPSLYLRLGALPQPERTALLGFIAQRDNPTLVGFDRLSVDVGLTSGLTDKQRFFRDRLLALGISRGFAPTRILWLSFDDPSASDGTPASLLVGYSAKRRVWTVLASAHGVYDGKLVATP